MSTLDEALSPVNACLIDRVAPTTWVAVRADLRFDKRCVLKARLRFLRQLVGRVSGSASGQLEPPVARHYAPLAASKAALPLPAVTGTHLDALVIGCFGFAPLPQ
jgi:hypothetical protein